MGQSNQGYCSQTCLAPLTRQLAEQDTSSLFRAGTVKGRLVAAISKTRKAWSPCAKVASILIAQVWRDLMKRRIILLNYPGHGTIRLMLLPPSSSQTGPLYNTSPVLQASDKKARYIWSLLRIKIHNPSPQAECLNGSLSVTPALGLFKPSLDNREELQCPWNELCLHSEKKHVCQWYNSVPIFASQHLTSSRHRDGAPPILSKAARIVLASRAGATPQNRSAWATAPSHDAASSSPPPKRAAQDRQEHGVHMSDPRPNSQKTHCVPLHPACVLALKLFHRTATRALSMLPSLIGICHGM